MAIDRVLLHVRRGPRVVKRAVDPADVYFLEAEDWEVKLEPPVNRVLPVARDALGRLEAAFGEGAGG